MTNFFVVVLDVILGQKNSIDTFELFLVKYSKRMYSKTKVKISAKKKN